MSNIIITAQDHISPNLARIAQALRDMRPAMTRVKQEIFRPLAAASQAQAPFKTGELRQAITPWSGKFSAGISIRRRGLVIPKAALLLKGSAAHKFKKRAKYRVRSRKGNIFERRNVGSPWGRVRRRRFFPARNELMGQTPRIEQIIAEYLRTAAEGQ